METTIASVLFLMPLVVFASALAMAAGLALAGTWIHFFGHKVPRLERAEPAPVGRTGAGLAR